MLYRHRSGVSVSQNLGSFKSVSDIACDSHRARTPSSNLLRFWFSPCHYCRSVLCSSGFPPVLSYFLWWLL